MASSLWWFLDLCVIAIIIISAYLGSKRGFLGTLVRLIGCVVAMALAVAVAPNLSSSIYDSLFKQSILNKTTEAISSYKASEEISLSLASHYEGMTLSGESVAQALSDEENISSNINALLCEGTGRALSAEETDKLLQQAFETTFSNKIEESLPAFCMQKLKKDTQASAQEMSQAVYAVISGNTAEAAEYIETTYIRPVIISVIKTVLIIIIFIVISQIIKLAANFALEALMPSPIKAVDKFAGLIIGAGLGLITIIVIKMAADALITLSDGELIFLNENTIENTRIFKHILLK